MAIRCLTTAGANQSTEIAGADAPGGNMEGKEIRFGISTSSLFAVITTAASCGAVIAMHDSFTPLGGLVPLANIGLGEVIFGGVGAGLYGILVYAVIAIFIAGLMVGRTPEYIGKKIEAYDVKMAMLTLLVIPLVILLLTGVSLVIGRRTGRDLESGTARSLRKCSMPSPPARETTARRSRVWARICPGTTSHSASPCWPDAS